jgi:Subtilase family
MPRRRRGPAAAPKPEGFSRNRQRTRFGPQFNRLRDLLDAPEGGLQLRADPAGLAPERLLVFEVRGSVQNFAKAIARVPGLDLIGEDELEPDDEDTQPVVYLLVPNIAALREIESLWRRWQRNQELGRGFTPWRDVFALLRDLRPWGPSDRVTDEEQQLLADEIRPLAAHDRARVELELVFRENEDVANEREAEVRGEVTAANGIVVTRSRIPEIAYHALLVELPVPQIQSIVGRVAGGIAGLDAIMFIHPQSLPQAIEIADITGLGQTPTVQPLGNPILALLDGYPVSQHPLLDGRLVVDDLFELEALTDVPDRTHGTAMASLVVHGDRNRTEEALPRNVFVTPILMGSEEQFPPDQLVVDLVYRAVRNLRAGEEPAAPDVIIVNLSIGNRRKPVGRTLSAWARLLDRLSMQYGLLFIVSAGNYIEPFDLLDVDSWTAFEDDASSRATVTIKSLDAIARLRRIISPGETVNGLTVGAYHDDSVGPGATTASALVDPFPDVSFSNPSSALGPGFQYSVKPDFLVSGAREHLSMVQTGSVTRARPTGASRAAGLKVAAPPIAARATGEGYTSGTSAAAALASRTAHRIHDALEAAYGSAFIGLSHIERAVLLKALLLHVARWPSDGADLIRRIVGPNDPRQHIRQRDNIRRFFGYGIVDPDDAPACAADRATFWAVGRLGLEELKEIAVPLPVCISGQARPHSVSATVAWFTPTSPGRQSYRIVRLRLLDPELHANLRVDSARDQPDTNQSARGTAIHRRWEGNRAATVGAEDTLTLAIQREIDRGTPIDEAIPFALAVSISMPGEERIYEEVLARVAIRPQIPA